MRKNRAGAAERVRNGDPWEGVTKDEEKDQRDCSHPRPLSERVDEARRLELRASDVNGNSE